MTEQPTFIDYPDTQRRRNDRVREAGSLAAGQFDARWVLTVAVADQGPEFVAKAIAGVRGYAGFANSDDPDDEHHEGQFEIDGLDLLWKIDRSHQLVWDDDGRKMEITHRVLTIMLASEY